MRARPTARSGPARSETGSGGSVCRALALPPRALLLQRNPGTDAGIEQVERQRALPHHLVMEIANRESVAQLFAGEGAQLLELQLAQLVGQRLPGPDDVAVDLDLDVVLGLRRIVHEELDGLLPGPALGVHAGVDHQA